MPSIADLNAKYSNAPTPTRTPAPEPGFFSKVGTGIKQGLSAGWNATFGVIPQIPGAVVHATKILGEGLTTGSATQKAINQRSSNDQAQYGSDQQAITNRIHTETDTAKKQQLVDYLNKNFNPQANGSVLPSAGDINPATNLSNKQVVGAAVTLAATALGNTDFGPAFDTVMGEGSQVPQWAKYIQPGTKWGTVAQNALTGGVFQGSDAAMQNKSDTNIALNALGGTLAGGGATAAMEFAPEIKGAVKNSFNPPKAAPSAIHLPTVGENGVYAKLTPEQYNHLYDETANMKSSAGDQPHLSPLDKLQASGAKEVSLDEIKAQSPNAKASLEAVPVKPSASRLADATASYNQVLKKGDITSFVKNPEGEMVPRVNEGKGIFGKESITPNQSEITNARELDNIKDYPDQGTKLEKAQAVKRAISNEAQGTEAKLQAEDEARPLNSKAKDIITKNVLDNMNRQAREVVMSRGQGIEGDALDRAGTVQGRYAQDVAEELNKYDGSRRGILKLRKNLDAIYEDARGKSAFGDANRNALDEMHTSNRDYLNKEVTESSQSVDVQASLDKQTKLFRAHDVLKNEAEIEARTYYGRLTQQHPALKMTARILSRQGIMIPLRVLEALAGVTALTSAAKKLTKK